MGALHIPYDTENPNEKQNNNKKKTEKCRAHRYSLFEFFTLTELVYVCMCCVNM